MTRSSRVLISLVLLAALSACSRDIPSAARRASGYVDATDVRVAAKVPGRVATVDVTEGMRVAAGDRVGTIATTDIDLAIERARAERSAAAAQLRLVQAGARREDVQQAQAQLAAAQADRRAAEAEAQAAAADEARFAQLVDRQAGTTKARDDAATRRQLAEARVKAAADRIDAARAAVERLQNGARPEEVDAARARVAAVDAQLASLTHDRDETTIVAPSAGIVTSRLVEPGELVAVGTPLVVLVDLDHAWVNAYVEEPEVPTLNLQQAATVVTDAGDRLAGTVSFISPRAEFTPRNVQTAAERARLVYRVKVAVDNRSGVLKPGMPVEVEWP